MTLLYHPNGPCRNDGVVHLCQYAEHNDGIGINPISAWNDFIAAVKSGPRVGIICPSRPSWRFDRMLYVHAAQYVTLQGYGQDVSSLVVNIPEGEPSQSAMFLRDWAGGRLQGFAVHCGGAGNLEDGLTIGSTSPNVCDRTQIVDVRVSGANMRGGALSLINAGQCSIRNSGFSAYTTAIPSGLDRPSPVVRLLGSYGVWFQDNEFHQYGIGTAGGNGPDTIQMVNSERVSFEGGIIGSEPDIVVSPGAPRGRAYISTQGVCSKVSLRSVLCQSDYGNPPRRFLHRVDGTISRVSVDLTSSVQVAEGLWFNTPEPPNSVFTAATVIAPTG
jgi:hypothetical protein